MRAIRGSYPFIGQFLRKLQIGRTHKGGAHFDSMEVSETDLNIRLKSKIRMAAVVLMVLYIAALAYVCFFSERYGRTVSDTYHYNLQPFREISRFFTYREVIGFRGFAINLLGNIVVFMPWGFMVPVIRKSVHKFLYTVISTFLLSLCIETIQLLTRVGSFDVDDLILNTLGGIAGFIVYYIVNTIRRHIFGKANL